MLGQSAGAYTNATHGMTLFIVSLPYYRYVITCGDTLTEEFMEVMGMKLEDF